MKISFAHLRERSTQGRWIDFAVFDARSNSGCNTDNETLLSQLTNQARLAGLKIDQSALAYSQGRQLKFFGTESLVSYLSKSGVPLFNKSIEV